MADNLDRWCRLANAAAYAVCGERNTCIVTSHALAEYLRRQGLAAEVFRAEVHVFCCLHDYCSGSPLGWDGDGTRRPKSAPGKWHGHLAVSCGDWVLDPTLDQADVGCGLMPAPAVFAKPDGWATGARHRWRQGDLDIGHERYRRQIGWKSKSDARPSHWLPIVEAMLAAESARTRCG